MLGWPEKETDFLKDSTLTIGPAMESVHETPYLPTMRCQKVYWDAALALRAYHYVKANPRSKTPTYKVNQLHVTDISQVDVVGVVFRRRTERQPDQPVIAPVKKKKKRRKIAST